MTKSTLDGKICANGTNDNARRVATSDFTIRRLVWSKW